MSRKSKKRKTRTRTQAKAQAERLAREKTSASASAKAETDKAKQETKQPKLKPIEATIQWLTTKETIALTQLSRTTMYKKIKARIFPQPIKIGKKSLWIESEINDWMKEQQQTLTERKQ